MSPPSRFEKATGDHGHIVTAIRYLLGVATKTGERVTVEFKRKFYRIDGKHGNNHAMLSIDILTLFPTLCEGAFGASMMKRAQESEAVKLSVHNLRDWAHDRHRTTDDVPFGGGQGMVLKPEPIFEAVESLRRPTSRVILLSAQGRVFRQEIAHEFAQNDHLIFVCGHYEGVDQRVSDFLVDDEISIGDYVLTNGAIVAAVIIDAIVRLLPGVLGNVQSSVQDSFSAGHGGLLEGPQYTRPARYREYSVPAILLSGNHRAIKEWRKEQAIQKTATVRPDLALRISQTS